MSAPSRCYGTYRPSWVGALVLCGRRKGHSGLHGPTEPPQKPALAQEHSETSKDAARRIEPVRGTLREKVLALIRLYPGGITDEEGIERTGLPASTYRPRRVELVEMNMVEASLWTRATRSGRKATVWIAVPSAHIRKGGTT